MIHRSSKLTLPCILAAFSLLWIYTPHEFVASDPWQYSLNAFHLAEGSFFQAPDNHPFNHRLGLTLPVSFAYSAFGVSAFSTHLWSLCCALLILCTIWWASPPGRPGTIALLMGACCVPLFRASTVLYPDIVVAAFTGLSSLMLYRRRRVVRGGLQRLVYPVASVLFLFIAFMAKLSSWWILPLWLIVFLADMKAGEWRLLRRFYLPALGAGVLLCAGYLWFCAVVWGDPFSRLHGIEALAGHHLWSWDSVSQGSLLSRLTVRPIILLGGGYNVLPLLALLSWPILPGQLRFWFYHSLCILICFWFGSASLHIYEPLPLSVRMTLPILTGLAITAGYFADRIAVLTLPEFLRRRHVALNLLLVAIIALPLLQHLFLYEHHGLPEARAMGLLREDLNADSSSRVLLVCADHRSVGSLAYYFSYSYPQNLQVAPVDEITSALLEQSDRVYVFLHEKRSRFLAEAYGEQNYSLEVLRAMRADVLYQEEPVWLWKCSVPENAESLMSVGRQLTSGSR